MAQLTLQQVFDLALQHHQAGRLHEAEQLYRQILAQQPEYADALHYLGVLASQVGQHDIAVDLIRRVIALRPTYAEAYGNLGKVLRDKGQPDEAIAALRQAIALKPNFPEAYNNLGNALKDKGQIEEAMAVYHQVLALWPTYAEPYNNLALALVGKGQLEEAIAAFRQAIALRPNFTEAHDSLIFTMHYHPGYDAKAIAEESRCWNQQHAEPLRKFIEPHTNDRSTERRLRIGYVSPDFREHVVGRNLLPLFRHHDRRQFEIICYSHVLRPDEMTKEFQRHSDGWRNIVWLSDEQAAKQIREDRIDLLVDLALHAAGGRLLVFARKPAPVQATWLGYVGTTGLSAMDYRISDPYLDPPGQGDEFYSEKTLRLPHCFWCYPPPDESPEVNDLPAAKTGIITFGCFNNFIKVTVPTLDLWAALMREVKGSQLVIHAHVGSHQETVRRHFASAGVEGSRIRFVGWQGIKDYFAQYGQIDVALDPFPYGGGTTTCDALWMGVPVVTLAGRTAVGRAGVSILSNLGLPELIAQTPEQYLSSARDLAADLPRLAQLRRELRPRMRDSILMDAPRFAAEMEAAYRQMWVNWCATKLS